MKRTFVRGAIITCSCLTGVTFGCESQDPAGASLDAGKEVPRVDADIDREADGGLDATGDAAAVPLERPMRIGYVQDMTSLGAVIADVNGDYNHVGLRYVMASPYPTGPDCRTDLVANRVDVCTVAAALVFAACARDPVTVIAAYNGTASSLGSSWQQSIVAAPGRGIVAGDAASLRGKRIGASIYLADDQFVSTVLARSGLTLRDVTMVRLTAANAFLGSLAADAGPGGVDAVTGFDPFSQNAQSVVAGAYEAFRTDPAKPIGQWGFHVVRKDFLAENEEAVRRYLEARASADKMQRTAPGRAASLGVQAGFAPDASRLEAQLAARTATLDPRLSAFSYRALDDAAGFLADNAYPNTCRFDVNDYFDPRVIRSVEDAHPELFDDLPPVPAGSRWTPGYVFRP